jgi:putative transposase
MSRRVRILIEDGLYHVTSRGDRQEPVYEDDIDRKTFLDIVGRGMKRYEAFAHAYCLMGNHYHLLVQTPRANLSQLMRHINGVFTQFSNRRHVRTGHLFQGRYHAVLVDRDAYFMEACRYVDLNPVRAELILDPAAWRWSSYRAHAGLDRPVPWLTSRLLHDCLAPNDSHSRGPDSYRKFVKEGLTLADRHSKDFAAKGDHKQRRHEEAIASKPANPRPDFEWYLATNKGRNAAIHAAFVQGGFSMAEIAEAVGISPSRVSQVVKQESTCIPVH